jgi:hypothetical protein
MTGDGFTQSLGEKSWLADGFKVSADETLAVVRDSGTGARLPFWLKADLAVMLTSLDEKAITYLALSQKKALVMAGILTTTATLRAKQDLWGRTAAACAEQFARRAFAPVAGIIPPFHISALRRYYRQLIRSGFLQMGDFQSPRRYVIHNESVTRYFHHQLAPAISMLAGEPVKPSYVFCASYQEGAELPQHLDRAQCEFSVTLCLDYTPEPERHTPWPIQLLTNDGQTNVFQALGDGLLYRGCRLPHSRARLPQGHSSTSIFFHYVAENFDGPLS